MTGVGWNPNPPLEPNPEGHPHTIGGATVWKAGQNASRAAQGLDQMLSIPADYAPIIRGIVQWLLQRFQDGTPAGSGIAIEHSTHSIGRGELPVRDTCKGTQFHTLRWRKTEL
jgi:hypothetical protein